MRLQYPLSPDVKPEFCTSGTFMRLPTTRDDARLAILGMPYDTAASYRVGARFGPQAIRQASMLLFPYNPVHGVYPFEETRAVDLGDLPIVPHNIQRSYEIIDDTVSSLMRAGMVPIGLGGDHSVTLASLRAARRIYGPVALIHFDSHSDTWDTYYGEKYWHGSPFIRACEEQLLDMDRAFQIGLRGTLNHPGDVDESREMGFQVVTMAELRRRGNADVVAEIKSVIGDRPCFLTFDIDFVDPAFAPGTGTPEVGGYSSWETLDLIRRMTGFRYVGFDVVEVLPTYDHAQITSLLAATLVHEFASLSALNLRAAGEAAPVTKEPCGA